MDISSSTIGAVSASIAVPLFMGLMRTISRFTPAQSSPKTLSQLTAEYSGWEKLATVATFAFTAILFITLWKLFTFISGHQLATLAPSKFLIGPPEALWALPALFLAIFSAVIPLHFFMQKLLGKERYAEFIEYGNRKHKLNTWKLLSYLAIFIIPITLALSVLAFDSYIKVTNDSFIINRFFSLGATKYTFHDIKYIELTKSFEAPNGNVVRRPYYTIGFTDGTNFSFHYSANEADISLQSELADFISKKCQIDISVNDPYPY